MSKRAVPPRSVLGAMTPATFLRRHWQKAPLFIKGGLPGLAALMGPDELAGLALEDGVESRLVLESGGPKPWSVEHGPFTVERLTSLPPRHWSLLVQGVERWLPDVAALLERFRFLPQWRLDDVMVSYAPDGGSVGPHVDNFDVFLIQGRGRRTWRVGPRLDDDSAIRPGLDLRILSAMPVVAEYECEEGDILYLPPRFAHHGIAVGEAMTFSVGFRAATHREMLTSFCATLLDEREEGERYADPDLAPVRDPAAIPLATAQAIRAAMQSVLDDDSLFQRWLGTFLTEPRHATAAPRRKPVTAQAVREAARDGRSFTRVPGARWAYIPARGGARLFVDGEAFRHPRLTAAQARFLATKVRFLGEEAAAWWKDEAFLAIVTALVNAGHLSLERARGRR